MGVKYQHSISIQPPKPTICILVSR